MSAEELMRIAMEEAEQSVREGSVPFACIVTDANGKIVIKEHDRVKETTDPTAHSEVNAIRKLCKQLHTLSLSEYTFYTTSEPCPTCMSSMIKAKVKRIYYGAKTEPTASLPIPAEYLAEKATREISVTGGILAEECLKQRTRLLN